MIVVCTLFFLMAENVLFFFAEMWVASSNLTAVFKRAVRQTGSFPAIVPHTRCLNRLPSLRKKIRQTLLFQSSGSWQELCSPSR